MLVLHQDVNDEIRRKICEIVAIVARNLIVNGNNQWTEILRCLYQWVNSTTVHLQESELRIYTRVLNIFGNLGTQYMESIKQKLKQLIRSSSVEVRLQAALKYLAFVQQHKPDESVILLQILSSYIKEVK